MEGNLTFGFFEEQSSSVAVLEHESVARTWLDPSMYDDVIGFDFGKDGMHFYSCAHARHWVVRPESANAAIARLPTHVALVGEWAHLGVPRTNRSLSQPFTAEQLMQIYSECKNRGIALRLMSHSHSASRAMGWAQSHIKEMAGAKKSDKNDAMAIALYVKHCNGISLAKPPKSFNRCAKRQYGLAVAKHANIVLNAARSGGYDGKAFPSIISLAAAIGRKTKIRLSRLARVSIAALIATEIEGKPCMYVRKGRAVGAWTWLRVVARMTPFHHYAGVSRSNLMWHTWRSFLRKYASRRRPSLLDGTKIIKFGKHNAGQRAVRTEAMREFRNAILDAYRVGVKIAEERGFQKFDPMSKEATDGR